MDLFSLVAVILTVTALFSWLNHRFIHLPATIGVMLVALVASLAMLAANALGVRLDAPARALLERVDFDTTLLQGMLSFLLFAGSLHVDLDDLLRQRGVISLLATAGVVVSTALVGLAAWGLFQLVGVPVDLVYCLVFGALVSPTDPIAVLALLKQAGVPDSLRVKITGESLFNDGVGVVVFLLLVGVATGTEAASAGHIVALFAREAIGGAAFGLAAGYAAYRLLRSIDEYKVEVLITLALVTGGYAAAGALHVSGPIAIVVAGLFIGNRGRRLAMSERTRAHLDTFWELVDEVLNAVLFVLIGFEVLAVELRGDLLLAGLLLIPAVLAARFLSAGLVVVPLRRVRAFTPHVVKILTWAGLRGGISVALALSLPRGPEREALLTATYAVVVFSVVVQGLTVGPLIRRWLGKS